MKTYHGTCHCGAVSFSFEHDGVIDKGVRCNCSICKRKGAVMSPFTIAPEQFQIKSDGDALGLYQFDSKVAKHYFCRTCGIYPFHQTLRQPGYYRVNFGCIDEIDSFALNIDVFDGKSL